MKKFLVIGFAFFLFTFVLSAKTTQAQWRWGGGYVAGGYGYYPAYSYRRVYVRRSPRYRRHHRRYRGGITVSFGSRRRYYDPYDPYSPYRRAVWAW